MTSGNFHKTADRQPIWFWLSQIDMKILLAYLELAHRNLEDNGIEVTADLPLFSNMKGEPYVGSSHNSSSFSKFCEIIGIPRFTFYYMRKMFIDFMWDQENATLREYATCVTANSMPVSKKHYVQNKTKQKKAAAVYGYYKSALNLKEDKLKIGKGFEVHTNKSQKERFKRMAKSVRVGDFKEMVDVQTMTHQVTKATIRRVITNKTVCALYQMIVKGCGDPKISELYGDIVELFLSDKPKVSKNNQSVLIYIIDSLPQDWECIRTIRDNLFDYCSLLGSEFPDISLDVLKEIEGMYSKKLLSILHDQGRNRGTSSAMILSILSSLANERGTLKYTLGSSTLKLQVSKFNHWDYPNMSKSQFKDNGGSKNVLNEVQSESNDLADPSSYMQVDAASLESDSDDEKKSKLSAFSCVEEQREFEIEESILNVPESPFKTRVKVGNKVCDSNEAVVISTFRVVSKKLKYTKEGNIQLNDDHKRSLLIEWINLATNKLPVGKTKIFQIAAGVRLQGSISIDGDRIPLTQITHSYDTVGQIFYRYNVFLNVHIF